jgi:hypothetical protein
VSHNIRGTPDMTAPRRMHFHSLSREEQAQAIRRLAVEGRGDHSIAAATGLSVEMVWRVLAERARP